MRGRVTSILLPWFLAVLAVGPSAGGDARAPVPAPKPDNASHWTYLGLGTRQVRKLRLHGDVLYACTGDGLHRRALAAADTMWSPLGLAGRSVRALWVASPETLLAATSVPLGDSVSLYRTSDGGASWQPYQNGFGAGWNPEVHDLAGIGASGRGLVGVAASIEKSTDGGAHWRQVALGCVLNFVQANPAASGHLWAGGETCIFWPVILRSTDAGDSWEEMLLQAGGDNACDAVAFHPSDPDIVYTGMEGRVQRTQDGGRNWEEVTSPNSTLYMYGMAIRPRLPLRIYAAGAGTNPDPRGVVLYTSDDGGRSWTADAQPASLRFGVFDLLYVEQQGEDWVFLATDHGVYRHADTITALELRSWTGVKGLFRPRPGGSAPQGASRPRQ